MRKQLGILTSLAFLMTTAALWMGCAHNWSNGPDNEIYYSDSAEPFEQGYGEPYAEPRGAPCAPPCGRPCAPVCRAPCERPCAPVCEPPCHPRRCHYPNANELCCRDGIIVSARNPSMCMLGDQYPFEFDIKACDDVCDVVVVTHLPEGVSFVRSTPEAKVEGRTRRMEYRRHEKRRMPPSQSMGKMRMRRRTVRLLLRHSHSGKILLSALR